MSDFQNFLEKTKFANVVPVIETLPADLLTPLSVYLKLAKNSANSFLLESVEGGETLARYSFIGVEPEMIVSGNNDRITIRDRNGEISRDISMFAFLREHFGANKVLDDADLPSFIGGAIGFLGFSCSGWFEPSIRITQNEAESSFMFFRSVVAFDHAKQLIKIVTIVFTGEAENDAEKLERIFNNAVAENERVKKTLNDASLSIPANELDLPNGEITSNWTQPEFETAVNTIKDLIAAGECYQVVLSQCFSKATNAHPVSIYRAMRSLNPSPYMFLIRLNDKAIIGASPEMLVRCRGRKLEYRPIAGTRHRGKTHEEDIGLAAEMRADKKEVAEHLMLVDLGRNDLGRVADYGTINVDGLMSVEKYSHVQHLVSYLSGDLRADLDRFDALASCFPAGTVSGAPKVRAIEIIQRLEPTPRGIYAGSVGYFDYAGNMDTCITIRTIVLQNGIAKVQAGAGIVADSVPPLEFQETINKAKALLRAIEIAEETSL